MVFKCACRSKSLTRSRHWRRPHSSRAAFSSLSFFSPPLLRHWNQCRPRQLNYLQHNRLPSTGTPCSRHGSRAAFRSLRPYFYFLFFLVSLSLSLDSLLLNRSWSAFFDNRPTLFWNNVPDPLGALCFSITASVFCFFFSPFYLTSSGNRTRPRSDIFLRISLCPLRIFF